MFRTGIYAILDAEALGLGLATDLQREWPRLVEYAIAAREGGAVAIQLRAKDQSVSPQLRADLALALCAALAGAVDLVVNDDPAAAVAAGCGLHLGQGDGAVDAARQRLGPGALIGWSTHDLAQVDVAQGEDCDYIGFGPVRHTRSKRGADPVTGWAGLADACRRSTKPVVAIGGLELADVLLVRSAGAYAMAVIGAWLGQESRTPELAYAALRRLSDAWSADGSEP